jgi:hypothetical protein
MRPQQVVGHSLSESDQSLYGFRRLANQTRQLGGLAAVTDRRLRIAGQKNALANFSREHYYALVEHGLKNIGNGAAIFTGQRHDREQHVSNSARIDDVAFGAGRAVPRSRYPSFIGFTGINRHRT